MTGACRVDAAPELLGGRYRLVSWLGTGGMAEVFRARDLLLNRDVAVKVFHDHTLDDPLTLARARSETRLMARLSHRHLVTLYDASFPEPGTAPPRTGLRPPAYLVMELVAGPVLSAAIRGQQLELDEAARVGAGVAAALGHVHSAGVVQTSTRSASCCSSASPGVGNTQGPACSRPSPGCSAHPSSPPTSPATGSACSANSPTTIPGSGRAPSRRRPGCRRWSTGSERGRCPVWRPIRGAVAGLCWRPPRWWSSRCWADWRR